MRPKPKDKGRKVCKAAVSIANFISFIVSEGLSDSLFITLTPSDKIDNRAAPWAHPNDTKQESTGSDVQSRD